jgi:hypothetical protein
MARGVPKYKTDKFQSVRNKPRWREERFGVSGFAGGTAR